MTPSRAPGPDHESIATFVRELRDLRSARGNPTLKSLEKRTGRAVSTLSEALGGKRLPTLDTVELLVRALGVQEDAEIERWRTRWTEARYGTAPPGGTDPGPDPGPDPVERSTPTAERTPGRRFLVRSTTGVATVAGILGLAVGAVTTWLIMTAWPPTASPTVLRTVNTGDDPVIAGCQLGAEAVTDDEVPGVYRLELMWSPRCRANWARLTRLDLAGYGNRIEAVVTGRFADPPPPQSTARDDVADLYTPMMVVTDIDADTVCASGTVWTAGKPRPVRPICR